MGGDQPLLPDTPTLASARPQADLEGRLVLQAMRGAMFGTRSKPVSVGRYELLERLGSGALGLVVAAHDPELDRRVAIKLLPARVDSRKLLREARALARLSSPHVVAVLDVGTFEPEDLGTLFSGDPGDPAGTGIWLAMELVDGAPLDTWIRRGPHAAREVLRVFREAGQGLLDAHRARIIHRDFKPANVILGHDGRVRVVDFGLARSPNLSFMTSADAAVADDDAALMRGLIGTPAYMSPEQHKGEPTDARADQFSFCVSLYEALYGILPYPGPRYDAFLRDKLAGPPPLPAEPSLPPAIRDALLQGLHPDPAQRLKSMEELLAALTPASRSRAKISGRVVAGAIVAMGVLATGILAVSTAGECVIPEGDSVRWGRTKTTLVSTIAALDPPYAKAAAFRVQEVIEASVTGWSEVREQACEAHTMPPATEQCMVQTMRGLDAVMDKLAATTPEQLRWVEQLLETTPDGGRCLADPSPAAETANATVAVGLRHRILIARLKSRGGDPEAGLKAAQSVSRAALDFGFAPVVAEASFARGESAWLGGDLRLAKAAMQDALERAQSAQYPELVALAAASLVRIAATHPDDDLSTWVDRATSAATGAHGRSALLVHSARGAGLAALGQWEEAIGAYEQARMASQADATIPPPEVARVHGELADALLALGRHEEASAEADRALSLAEATFGPGHPDLAVPLARAGRIAFADGRTQEAQTSLRRALELYDAGRVDAGGAGATREPRLAKLLVTLAEVVSALGREGEASGLLERAAVLQATVGPLAETLRQLCGIALRQGDVDAARVRCEEAMAVQRARSATDEAQLAQLEHQSGMVRLAAGDLLEAEAYLERGLARAETRYGPGHPQTAALVIGLAQLRRRQGRVSDAVALLDRVAAMSVTLGAANHEVAVAVARRAWLMAEAGKAQEAIDSVVAHLANAGPALGASDRFELEFAHAGALRWAGRVGDAMVRARRARQEYARTDGARSSSLARLDRWLEAGPPR